MRFLAPTKRGSPLANIASGKDLFKSARARAPHGRDILDIQGPGPGRRNGMRRVTIDVRRSGRVCILDIGGEVRIGEPTERLRRESKKLVDAGERFFVLDMLDVPWLDSSGIGEVFACYKRARELDGVVKLVLKGKPYSLFTITQLDRVFEIFDSVDEAVATFSA
jgi:anti-sigma B factor antagonist